MSGSKGNGGSPVLPDNVEQSGGAVPIAGKAQREDIVALREKSLSQCPQAVRRIGKAVDEQSCSLASAGATSSNERLYLVPRARPPTPCGL